MLILYHTSRAVCAQKVRLALAEKAIGFESRLLAQTDLRSPEYLGLNPHGYVPTLIHDGAVITESRTISEYLEDAFPTPHLMPLSSLGKARVRNWTKQIDDSLHLNIFILSFVTSFRQKFLVMPATAQANALPLTPFKRHITLELLDQGADSVFFRMAVTRFLTLLGDMNVALCEAKWLSGDAYGLADVDYTPYLRRLEELGFWQLVDKEYPEVGRWFEAVRSRPSFAQARRSDRAQDLSRSYGVSLQPSEAAAADRARNSAHFITIFDTRRPQNSLINSTSSCKCSGGPS